MNAELILQIRDSVSPKGFRDGDIVHAFNVLWMLWRHTLRITDHRKIEGGFFKPMNSMAYRRLRATSLYMRQRISTTEVRTTNLETNEIDVQAGVLDGNERSPVEKYFARRIAGGKKAMFGIEKRAVWFEGQRELTLPILSTLWAEYITPATGFMEAAHRSIDHNTPMLRNHLILAVTDFDNIRRGRLEESDVEEFDNTGIDPDSKDYRQPITHAQRKRNVDWRNLSGMSGDTIDRLLDRKQRVEPRRDIVRDETTIVRERVR